LSCSIDDRGGTREGWEGFGKGIVEEIVPFMAVLERKA